MHKILPFLLAASWLALGCSSSSAVRHDAPPPVPSAVESEPAASPPPPPERSCDQLTRDAHELVSAHSGCTQDADCAMTAAACPGGFACGRGVRASDASEVNAALAELSRQFKAQCRHCASERVRCMGPNPVCREGTCVHEAPEQSCERLDQEAEALIAAHDACASDADCVFARDDGGCPPAFACGSVVNKDHAAAFTQSASALSRTYHEHCGQCVRQVAECRAATPICSQGHCARRFDR